MSQCSQCTDPFFHSFTMNIKDPVFYLPLLLFRSPASFKQPMAGFGGCVGDAPTGFGKAFDLSRSRSPQSDAGYGTSFDSNESRAQSARRDIDIDGLSELLVMISC